MSKFTVALELGWLLGSTKVVWKSTTQIGCAVTSCADGTVFTGYGVSVSPSYSRTWLTPSIWCPQDSVNIVCKWRQEIYYCWLNYVWSVLPCRRVLSTRKCHWGLCFKRCSIKRGDGWRNSSLFHYIRYCAWLSVLAWCWALCWIQCSLHDCFDMYHWVNICFSQYSPHPCNCRDYGWASAIVNRIVIKPRAYRLLSDQ